jgi:MFS family permease
MMTFGSVGNALGPIVGSFLYAAALNWPPPTDGRLVFVIGALIIVCIGVTVGRFLMPVVA